MHTAGILYLAKYYLEEKKFQYFLCGRISSDCIENYFSQMRRRHMCPTGMEFQSGFKALFILQHMRPNKHGNHREDCTDWYTSLKDVKALELQNVDLDLDEDPEECKVVLGNNSEQEFSQSNGLAYLCGYILSKTVCAKPACSNCKEVLTDVVPTLGFQTLIANKELKQGKLTLPSLVAHDTFSFCESTFNENAEKIKIGEVTEAALVNSLVNSIPSTHPQFPTCHLRDIVKRFVKIRLHFWLEQKTIEMSNSKDYMDLENNSGFASKTMGAKYMSTFTRS